MGGNLALAIYFLIPFAAVLWVWRGVRIWQVGAIGLAFGVGCGAIATLASYATDLTLGPILGPGPEGWLARRLACAAGLACGGLIALALTRFRRRPPGDES